MLYLIELWCNKLIKLTLLPKYGLEHTFFTQKKRFFGVFRRFYHTSRYKLSPTWILAPKMLYFIVLWQNKLAEVNSGAYLCLERAFLKLKMCVWLFLGIFYHIISYKMGLTWLISYLVLLVIEKVKITYTIF